MKTRDRTKQHLDILQTDYNSARRLFEIRSPLEWLEQQLSARINLEEAGTSFKDDLILQYLYNSFRESPAGKYIEQCLNTDGVEFDQFIQGVYDRSSGLELDKESSSAALPGVPANAAKFPANGKPLTEGICQWCGVFSHGVSQCRALLKLVESSDRRKPHHCLGGPDDEKLAKEKLKSLPCSHCDKPGRTADYCWELHPELMPAKFRKSESETEKKKEPEVKAAVAKPGDGGNHTYTMRENPGR